MPIIDEYDRKILEILQDNGALSNTEVAGILGISEATVRRRRAQLQENDVMRIVAVANPFKLGYKVMTIIGIQVEQSLLKQVERNLVDRQEVRFLGIIFGNYDLLLEAWFRSREELLHFVTIDLAQMPGVKRTESFQVMHLAKYTYDWGTPTAARQVLVDETQQETSL